VENKNVVSFQNVPSILRMHDYFEKLKLNLEKNKKVRLFVFLLVISLGVNAQTIINAERVGGTKDSSVYSLSLSYNGTRGNSTTDQVSVSPVVILKKKKNAVKFFASYQVLSSGENSILNNGFVHLRHNYKMKSFLKTILFYQLQFNEVLHLAKREVVGAGFRFDLIRKDSLSAALSIGAIHEYEVLSRDRLQLNEVSKTNYVRGSVVGSFKWVVNEYLQINDVLYYQPYLQNFSDYRILNDINLSVRINKYFSVLLISSVRFDSQPPSVIVGSDWNFRVGLSYKRAR